MLRASPLRRLPQLVESAIGKAAWFSVPKTDGSCTVNCTYPAIFHAPPTSRAIPRARRPHHLAHSPAIGGVAASLREARFSGLEEVPQDRVFWPSLKRLLDKRGNWCRILPT